MQAIYTDIGRGHPNYLDSTLRYLSENHPEHHLNIRRVSVFEISRGLSLVAWNLVRRTYKLGARGGVISALYSGFRARHSEYDEESFLLRILQRDLFRHLEGYSGVCLVAHPLLANMLKSRYRVFYLHGEIAAPRESAVTGVDRIYVPLAETAQSMVDFGVDAGSLMETGLVIEPELCIALDETVKCRLGRIGQSDSPLTVGFCISGGYPKRHVDFMLLGAESLYHAGHNTRFFWGCDGRRVKKLLSAVRRFDESAALDSGGGDRVIDARTVIIAGESRMDETIRSMRYIPELDLFCAAPHERVNWAVGAGLPMIAITPIIGTFAPQNLEFVVNSGCGIDLSDERDYTALADIVSGLRRDGRLASMVQAGRRIGSVSGARVIAEDLIAEMSE